MMTHTLSEQPDPERAATIQATVDREFAGHDLRHAHRELDDLLDEMRRDAEFLDNNGDHAGATLMRRNADRITEVLGRVRDAEAVLNYTGGIQR